MKKYAAAVLIIIIAAMFTGCSDTEEAVLPPDNAAIGVWNLYSVVIDQSEYIGESADSVLEGASDCVLTVTAEGTFDFSIGGADVVGTYTAEDGKITFFEDNSEFPVTVEGDRLTLDLTSYSGMDMQYVFAKNASG